MQGRHWLRQGLKAGLLAILSLQALPALAAEPEIIRRQPVLAILPALTPTGSDPACSQALYQTLIRQQDYSVLPDWYVLERLDQAPARWQSDWSGLFARLPEAEFALLSQLEPAGPHQPARLVTILVQQAQPLQLTPQILRSEVLEPGDDLAEGCRSMALRLSGEPPNKPFQSPALSATLSLLIPGAGHLYRGGADGFAMGAGLLGAYVVIAYLGFSDSAPGVSRSQWGGLLILLTLVDVVTAYFLADR